MNKCVILYLTHGYYEKKMDPNSNETTPRRDIGDICIPDNGTTHYSKK